MIHVINIDEFLVLRTTIPVVDVRSPGEYDAGHIPGAVNIPLFDNDERARVGTLYKKSGKEAAVFLGLDIVGKKLKELAGKGNALAKDKKLLVHCWRGGMRSENMAMLFSTLGINCFVLKGGYKSYRKFIRQEFTKPLKVIILSGATGSGKSELLNHLQNNGEQVIDLESLSNHKGSAFGSLGQKPQPTNEQFENNLFDIFKNINPDKRVWIEDESHNIGKIYIPEPFYQHMRNAFCLKINLNKEIRIKRLLKEYGNFAPEILIDSVKKIYRRLGGQHAEEAMRCIKEGNLSRAIDLILVYYDKTYLFGFNKRDKSKVCELELKDDNHAENAKIIINHINNLKDGRIQINTI
ncbi:MAG: tRNA 2-selenouridine(34) synthase MnmH [Marinilabiliales bacterium]